MKGDVIVKRIIALALTLILLLSGCSSAPKNASISDGGEKTTGQSIDENKDDTLFRGAWISYIELKKPVESEAEYRKYIESLFVNMKKVGTTDVFVHVRAFGDALYESELFPYGEYMFHKTDVLALALSLGEKYNMGIHPWINPYRALYYSDADKNTDSTIKTWAKEESPNILCVDGKYYLNPASGQARELIIDGVREILTKYPAVKGIHIDDYFYPEGIGDADREDYDDYLLSGGKLSVASWRRENVSSLVGSLYSAVKSFSEDKIFSVSPSGSIERNVDTLYADVPLWASQKGFCDMLIPQIYFGFENESMPFMSTVDEWSALTEESDVRLSVGLALYKCGEEDVYAGSGRAEWLENNDIISRQIRYVEDKDLDGYSLYSASFVNFSEKNLSEEVNNIKNVI